MEEFFYTIKSKTAVPPANQPIALVPVILNPAQGPLSHTPYMMPSSTVPS